MKLIKTYLEKTLLKELGSIEHFQSIFSLIESRHSENHRHYHTLEHLESMFYYLDHFGKGIEDKSALTLSILFHDIIYIVKGQNNELMSANFAEKVCENYKFDKVLIEKCKSIILASADHKEHEDSDTNYFLDIDLNILGQPWEKYENYTSQIRQEYNIYPDHLYIPGRLKILKQFTKHRTIYKTRPFLDTFEKQAQSNLKKELMHLQEQTLLL